ncbi:unnamed protein product [Fraxinus pennsylvanica]|uniref:Uncharacterized protein n=1 Tax=Fraxinus pennsylvanica TaxID=56036 RepID=A0AAD2AA61_9LAMI|nr:unnamed protein product [Fraxinus pennsylvanica]
MGNCCPQGAADDSPTGDNEVGKAESKSKHHENASMGNAIAPTNTTPPSASPNHSTKPLKPTPIGPVLGQPMEDVCSTYTIGKELGRGQFGVTHLCTNRKRESNLHAKRINLINEH